MYVDLVALALGRKEQLTRKDAKINANLIYGCPRDVRDEILYLPKGQLIEILRYETCQKKTCQYWYQQTGVNTEDFVYTCLLARYSLLSYVQTRPLCLNEIGRMLYTSRQWVQRIEGDAFARIKRLQSSRMEPATQYDTREYSHTFSTDTSHRDDPA